MSDPRPRKMTNEQKDRLAYLEWLVKGDGDFWRLPPEKQAMLKEELEFFQALAKGIA